MHTLHKLTGHLLKNGYALVPFMFPLALIFLFEGVMGFTFPIFVENTLQSNLIMGLIMASSSAAGLIFDFLLPRFLRGRSWQFQLLISLIIAIPFPILTVLGKEWVLALFFLFGSVLWGLYFEILGFAQQSFIVSEETPSRFSRDWAMIFIIWNVTGILGPIIGAQLLTLDSWLTMSVLLSIIGSGLVFAWLATMVFTQKARKEVFLKPEPVQAVSTLQELRIWKKLSWSVLPAIVLGTTAKSVEATYWVLGGIFAQEILTTFNGFNLDWLLILTFTIPMTLGSVALLRLSIKKHKKRISQISLILAGIPLLLFVFLPGKIALILAVIIISSSFLSFAEPLNESVYSDLLKRAGEFRNELLGISRLGFSLAYTITPIVMGAISEYFGYYWSFSFLGFSLVLIGVLLLIFTPRKLKIPHAALEQIV